ncbi:uncharacterized protein V6R79_024487 [Siganus canaliculatus]
MVLFLQQWLKLNKKKLAGQERRQIKKQCDGESCAVTFIVILSLRQPCHRVTIFSRTNKLAEHCKKDCNIQAAIMTETLREYLF